MIHRLTVPLPREGGSPMRILAVSDEIDASLSEHLDRDAIGPLDLLVSCGDLPPDYLCYLEGVLRVPFVYVTGNHDLDDAWRHEAARLLPARGRKAELTEIGGLTVALLDWPGDRKARTRSQGWTAWRDALGVRWAAFARRARPWVIASHVPPHDPDDPRDVYHRGFSAYRWLIGQLRPILWLHGHATTASEHDRVVHLGPTTCVNVTGAYLIELVPEGSVPSLLSSSDGRSDDPPGDPQAAERTAPRPD